MSHDSSEFWDRFDREKPRYLSEELAPPIDEDLLRKVISAKGNFDDSGPLTQKTARRVLELVDTFQSWHDAYLRISLEVHQENSGSDDISEDDDAFK